MNASLGLGNPSNVKHNSHNSSESVQKNRQIRNERTLYSLVFDGLLFHDWKGYFRYFQRLIFDMLRTIHGFLPPIRFC